MTIPVLLGNKVRANTLVRSKELTEALRKNVVYEFQRGFLSVSKIVKSGILVFEKQSARRGHSKQLTLAASLATWQQQALATDKSGCQCDQKETA